MNAWTIGVGDIVRSLVQLVVPVLILIGVAYVMTRRRRQTDSTDSGAGLTLLGIMLIGSITAIAMGWIVYVFLEA